MRRGHRDESRSSVPVASPCVTTPCRNQDTAFMAPFILGGVVPIPATDLHDRDGAMRR